ncbi:MAG: S41 family peptidase [Chloroflexota bacterium]
MQRIYRILITALTGLFLFGLGIGVGYGLTIYFQDEGQPATVNDTQEFDLLQEVWGYIDEQFYDGLPESDDPAYGAIRGALASLGDPYTIFVEPKPRKLEKAELEGQYGGIGSTIQFDENGQVRLIPLVDSAAEKAGVQKNDLLLKVDDTDVLPGISLDDVRALIIGDIGTEVTLTLSRTDVLEPLVIAIERAVIETPSVSWRITAEDDAIGYIKISLFSNRTNKELDRAFEELKSEGATHYVLDLRGNGGGLLNTAVDVSSQFLSDGVVLIEDRRSGEPKEYPVRDGGKLLDEPLVILVDGGTASASEIVAGALQDYERAILIGERTFGKASVQLVYDLSDESSLHVTVAKWFTPNNKNIDGEGLMPNLEVLFSEEDHTQGRDPQYLAAIEYLQAQP